MGNRSSAQQAIATMIKNGTNTPERVENVLAQWGVNDEEDRAFILEGAQELSRSIEQQNMETWNAERSTQMQAWQKQNSETVSEIKASNTEGLMNHFASMPDSVKSAVSAVADSYAIDKAVAVGLSGNGGLIDYINSEMERNKSWSQRPQNEIARSIVNYLSSAGVPTYAGMQIGLNTKAQTKLGLDRYTPQQYVSVLVPSLDMKISSLVSRIELAIESNNYDLYARLQQEAKGVLEAAQQDTLERQKTMKQSFGSYAKPEEVMEAVGVMSSKIEEMARKLSTYQAPDKPKEMARRDQAKLDEIKKSLQDAEQRHNRHAKKFGEGSTQELSAKREVERINREIEDFIKMYTPQ